VACRLQTAKLLEGQPLLLLRNAGAGIWYVHRDPFPGSRRVFACARLHQVGEHCRTRSGSESIGGAAAVWLIASSLLIRDVTGDFYRIRDPGALDRKSRALLWAFVD
jgi:hypothetical protein